MNSPICREVSHFQYLRERLAAEFPDADEATLRDTVAGLTNLPEMLAAVVRSHLDDKSLVTALRARTADMLERLSRFEARAEKKRQLVMSAMERADLKKLTEPDFTLSLRRTQAPLVIVDEQAIPEGFWVPQPARLDRQGLIRALKAGREITGAILGNSAMTLALRTN